LEINEIWRNIVTNATVQQVAIDIADKTKHKLHNRKQLLTLIFAASLIGCAEQI